MNLLLAAAALSTSHHHATTNAPTTTTIATFISSEGSSRRLATRTARKKISRPVALTYTVTATAYQAVPGQTDDEPFVTADNSNIKPQYSSKTRWMALSQDLLARWGGDFQYGDQVVVSGISPHLDGVYTVHDTMNKRHHHCMDILTHTSERIDIFTKNVKIRLVVATSSTDSVPITSRARATSLARLRSATRRPEVDNIFLAKAKRTDYFASTNL